MEQMLRLLVQGMELISEALQLALMQYQTEIEEERAESAERSFSSE